MGSDINPSERLSGGDDGSFSLSLPFLPGTKESTLFQVKCFWLLPLSDCLSLATTTCWNLSSSDLSRLAWLSNFYLIKYEGGKIIATLANETSLNHTWLSLMVHNLIWLFFLVWYVLQNALAEKSIKSCDPRIAWAEQRIIIIAPAFLSFFFKSMNATICFALGKI